MSQAPDSYEPQPPLPHKYTLYRHWRLTKQMEKLEVESIMRQTDKVKKNAHSQQRGQQVKTMCGWIGQRRKFLRGKKKMASR